VADALQQRRVIDHSGGGLRLRFSIGSLQRRATKKRRRGGGAAAEGEEEELGFAEGI
jgi:hypothetical protein